MPNPHLYFKYNQGLGDFVASFLHCKAIGWLTKLITGKSEPCQICAKRGMALNVLFPIPFWRLFFKDQKSMLESFNKDLQAAGYQTSFSTDPNSPYLQSMKPTMTPVTSATSVDYTPLSFFKHDEKLSKYTFISSSDNEIDHILIRTQIFKLKP